MALHEAREQEGGEGLLRDHQAAHGPGDHDQQDQVPQILLQRGLPGEIWLSIMFFAKMILIVFCKILHAEHYLEVY